MPNIGLENCKHFQNFENKTNLYGLLNQWPRLNRYNVPGIGGFEIIVIGSYNFENIKHYWDSIAFRELTWQIFDRERLNNTDF